MSHPSQTGNLPALVRAASSRPDPFARTRWSLVMALRDGGAASAERSLADLCRDYWYPVYAYVRRCGHAAEPAQRLTGRFFAHLAEEIRSVDPAQFGQFRHFLLTQLHRFLAEPESAGAGADDEAAPPIAIEELELRLRRDHVPDAAPDHVFQRGFALEVLGRSLRRLRHEAQESGRGPMFELLERYLIADPPPGHYEQMAARLGYSALALLVAVKRLRQRFRELVDAELCETVASVSDLETERATLLAILGALK